MDISINLSEEALLNATIRKEEDSTVQEFCQEMLNSELETSLEDEHWIDCYQCLLEEVGGDKGFYVIEKDDNNLTFIFSDGSIKNTPKECVGVDYIERNQFGKMFNRYDMREFYKRNCDKDGPMYRNKPIP